MIKWINTYQPRECQLTERGTTPQGNGTDHIQYEGQPSLTMTKPTSYICKSFKKENPMGLWEVICCFVLFCFVPSRGRQSLVPRTLQNSTCLYFLSLLTTALVWGRKYKKKTPLQEIRVYLYYIWNLKFWNTFHCLY